MVTRLAHSRSGVECKSPKAQNLLNIPTNLKQFILLPAIAKKNYAGLLGKQNDFMSHGEKDGWNTLTLGKDRKLGIIASGIGYNYLMENYPDGCPYSILKISQYPLPVNMLTRLAAESVELLVIEDGYPFIEEQIKSIIPTPLIIRGRLDGTLPRMGELNPNIVAQGLGIKVPDFNIVPEVVKPRPPKLCDGCPHISSYNALNEALSDYVPGRVFADIGCYTLGALPPYNAINSCVDMGASITMAKGAFDAGIFPAVAIIGDSTFTHSGMTGLLDAILDKSAITVMILDNETTGMTGGQDSCAFGRIENICLGLGVEKEHIRVIIPLPKNHEENVKVIKEELEYKGVSVIVPRRECLQVIGKKHRRR